MVLCHSTTCPIESSHTVLGVLVQSTTLLKVSSSPITCFINYFMAYFQNFHHTMFNSLITVLLGKESPWYNAFVFANYNHMENIIPLKWETNFFSSLLLPFPPLFSLHFLKKKKKKRNLHIILSQELNWKNTYIFQTLRHGFNLWVRKIRWRRE